MKIDTAFVVILLIVKNNKILLEQREFKGETHWLYPGGRIHQDELEDLSAAVIREAEEELGITPTKLLPILQEDFKSEIDTILRPFIVTEWKGDFPEAILDTDAPLKWLTLDEAINSPLESISKMAQAVRESI